MSSMGLADVVATASEVASSSARNDKVAALAGLLARLDPVEAPVVVGLLTGEVRQGRIGVGWAAVRDLVVSPADESTLLVSEIDLTMTTLAEISGSGSKARRAELLEEFIL